MVRLRGVDRQYRPEKILRQCIPRPTRMGHRPDRHASRHDAARSGEPIRRRMPRPGRRNPPFIPLAATAPELGVSSFQADFFCPASPDRCRVIEVWSLDCRDTGADSSVKFDFVWHCRFLAPDGTLLYEHDSPYSHGSHPFVVKLYPLTDGEVHPFVEDVIDQQRHINRIIVMLDRMMSAAAKGVLLFPEDQMSQLTNWHDISAIWAHPHHRPRRTSASAGCNQHRRLRSLPLPRTSDEALPGCVGGRRFHSRSLPAVSYGRTDARKSDPQRNNRPCRHLRHLPRFHRDPERESNEYVTTPQESARILAYLLITPYQSTGPIPQ